MSNESAPLEQGPPSPAARSWKRVAVATLVLATTAGAGLTAAIGTSAVSPTAAGAALG